MAILHTDNGPNGIDLTDTSDPLARSALLCVILFFLSLPARLIFDVT